MDRQIESVMAAITALPQGQRLLLFLDYDGTLVEIAPRPELATPSPELLELLARLAARPGWAVVVVSGRPLQDLLALLPVPGLNYLGSHGGEGLIQGQPGTPQDLVTDPAELEELKRQARESLKGLSGWWLEDKPLGFALHYRQASASEEAGLLAALTPWLAQVARQGKYQILWGKKVVEILPVMVNKGAAIQTISAYPGFSQYLPLYLGDDYTDESVFQVLAARGLTIKVGRSSGVTAAAVSLPQPAVVREFLARLAHHREER